MRKQVRSIFINTIDMIKYQRDEMKSEMKSIKTKDILLTIMILTICFFSYYYIQDILYDKWGASLFYIDSNTWRPAQVLGFAVLVCCGLPFSAPTVILYAFRKRIKATHIVLGVFILTIFIQSLFFLYKEIIELHVSIYYLIYESIIALPVSLIAGSLCGVFVIFIIREVFSKTQK